MDAALFDWRGTLVDDFPDSWWVERAFKVLGREEPEGEVERLCARLGQAAEDDDIRAGFLTEDCSATLHRDHNLKWFDRAGLDADLSRTLYELDFDPAMHPFYTDAPLVLEALCAMDVHVAVVSDIHFDLRPEFEAADLIDYVDAFVLSCEHGCQKPDRRMFDLALDELGVAPSRAVMVGDRASHDGGAAACGITTVILPSLASGPSPPPSPSLTAGSSLASRRERGLRGLLPLWEQR